MHQDLMDNQDKMEDQELQETTVQTDLHQHLDLTKTSVSPVQMDPSDLEVVQDLKDPMVTLDVLVHLGQLATPVPQDLKDHLDLQDTMDLQEHQEHQEHQEPNKKLLVNQDLQGHQDHQEVLVTMDNLELQVTVDKMDLLDHQEITDNQEVLVIEDSQETMDLMEIVDHLEVVIIVHLPGQLLVIRMD